MRKKTKAYEELTIQDDFMFGKVMRSQKRCKKFLEIVLGVPIRKIVFLDDQETLNPDYRGKGIRLDVYVEDEENTVYNVEMQAESRKGLPKRSRYYQSVIDINLMEKGSSYQTLRKSFVIFICCFDPFGAGRHVYHFENLCREDSSIRLQDEAEKIFLNTKGTVDDVDGELRDLLLYFETQMPVDDYTREIDAAVSAAKAHKEWRREYMKLEVWEQDIRYESRIEGAQKKLVQMVCRKMLKGKSPECIADELEEDFAEVKRICLAAEKYAPEYNEEKIFEELFAGSTI